MTTGQRMKQRRKELGLSAERIADALGVSPATIYRYEKGDIEKVPGDILEPLADILHTTPAALMGWESPDTPAGKQEPAAQAGSRFTPEQAELIRLFQAASPEIRAAALAVLRSAKAADKAQGSKGEE